MKAILACEKNGGIGFDDSMPWPKQEKDLARFKELTTGKTILMGRGTWESKGMPKPLPNRKNIIFSRSSTPLFDLSLEDVGQVWDLEGWLKNEVTIKHSKDYWLIGGAGLLASLWDEIDEIHLSHLREEYECDTWIELDVLNKEFYCSRSQLCLTHTYEIWKRRNEDQEI